MPGGGEPAPSKPVKKSTIMKAAPSIKAKVDQNEDLSRQVTDSLNTEIPIPKMIAPPEPPKVEYSDPTDALKQMGPMLAIWASLGTRKPMVTAMSAFGGAMQAQQKNDMEKYKEKHKEYEDNLKYALDENKQSLDVYHAIMDDKNKSVTEKLALIGSNSKTLRDPLMSAAAANSDTGMIYDLLGKRSKAAGHLGDVANGGVNDKEYDKYKSAPENIKAADAYARGVGVSELIRGRGAPAEKEFRMLKKLAAERHPDEDLVTATQDYKAGTAGKSQRARTIEQRAVPIETAIAEMDTLANPLVKAMRKINPSQYPDYNSIKNAVAKGTGDPEVVAANEAVRAYTAAIDQLLTRNGASTDSSRDAAGKLLNLNFTTDQIQSFIDQSRITARSVLGGINKVREAEAGGQEYKSLEELQKAHADGRISSKEAREIALDNGWAQ